MRQGCLRRLDRVDGPLFAIRTRTFVLWGEVAKSQPTEYKSEHLQTIAPSIAEVQLELLLTKQGAHLHPDVCCLGGCLAKRFVKGSHNVTFCRGVIAPDASCQRLRADQGLISSLWDGRHRCPRYLSCLLRNAEALSCL